MKSLILTLSVTLIFVTGCNRWSNYCDKPTFECSEKVQVLDLTGLDGCSIVFENSDGERMEPINLDEFDISIEDSMWIEIGYRYKEEVASICMVGPIIEITCLNSMERLESN